MKIKKEKKKKKEREKHYFVVSSSLTLQNNEPFLHWIVTRDKKWMVYNNQ